MRATTNATFREWNTTLTEISPRKSRERVGALPLFHLHLPNRSLTAQDSDGVQILKLLQTSASVISSQESRVDELDERKLRLEEARTERREK
jgi:hypothetical protein